jgi:hypothetical protein
MRSLSEQDILNIWEKGLYLHMVERAITILALADPQHSRNEALAMSIGQRDTHLLTIRERSFGAQFAGYATCPRCHEALDLTFSASDIRVTAPDHADERAEISFQHGDYALQARLLISADLLAITGCRTVAAARTVLLERCITHASHQGTDIGVSELPDSVIEALGDAIVERDTQAEIRLKLVCPFCDHHWFAIFDILTFLWQEIATHARRILRDVHLLASAYGWTETDILALSTVRRRLYLEMVSA